VIADGARTHKDLERAIANIIEARCKRNDYSYHDELLEVSGAVNLVISESDIT
jgi:hypothetical protein